MQGGAGSDALILTHLATLAETVTECPAVLVVTSRLDGDLLDAALRARTGSVPLVTDLGPLRPAEALKRASAFLGS